MSLMEYTKKIQAQGTSQAPIISPVARANHLSAGHNIQTRPAPLGHPLRNLASRPIRQSARADLT